MLLRSMTAIAMHPILSEETPACGWDAAPVAAPTVATADTVRRMSLATESAERSAESDLSGPVLVACGMAQASIAAVWGDFSRVSHAVATGVLTAHATRIARTHAVSAAAVYGELTARTGVSP